METSTASNSTSISSTASRFCWICTFSSSMRAFRVSLFWESTSTEARRLARSSMISSRRSWSAFCSSLNWEACSLRSTSLVSASFMSSSSFLMAASASETSPCFLSICRWISLTRPASIAVRSLPLEIAASEASLVRSASVMVRSASRSF